MTAENGFLMTNDNDKFIFVFFDKEKQRLRKWKLEHKRTYTSTVSCLQKKKKKKKKQQKRIRSCLIKHVHHGYVVPIEYLSAWSRNTHTQTSIGRMILFGEFFTYRDPFSVNGAKIGIFEQWDQISFARFLQRSNSRRLKAQVCLEVLGDFTHQPLKR